MTKQTAKDVIAKTKEQMLTGSIRQAMCWSGIFNDDIHFHLRADLIFLNIVELVDDEVSFKRIRPALIQKGKTGGSEMLYSGADVVRVTSGPRKGRVMPIELIRVEESYVPSGLEKKLEYRIDPDCLHINRKGDRACLDLLNNLELSTMRTVNCITDISPELYLVCRMGTEKLISRRNGKTVAWLQEQRTPEDTCLDDTAQRIANTCSQDAGPGMVAYPYEHYFGKGVVAAKVSPVNMRFGEWYEVLKGRGKVPGAVFDC